MIKEIYKSIKGYEELYEISNMGNVKSLKYNREKLLSHRFDGKGYCMVALYKDGKSKNYKVHRLVAEAFIDNPDNKEQVNHIDGNKTNNRTDNLEWCTNYENCIHAHNNGLIARPNPHKGEDAYNHKLTKDDIDYIRKYYIKGSKKFGSTALAKKFNVSSNLILLIVKNKRWKEGA